MNKLLIFFFSFFCLNTALAQQKIIDSLEKIVNNKSISDTDKIISVSRLTEYYKKIDTIRALRYAEKAINLAKNQNDKYKVYAYSSLMSAYTVKWNTTPAYGAMEKCLEYIEKVSEKDVKAYGLIKIAYNLQSMDDRDEVVGLLLKAEKLLDKTSYWELKFENYYNLLRYYLSLDLKNTEKYAKLVLTASYKTKNPELQAMAWISMGAYYQKEMEQSSDLKFLEEANKAYKKAITIYTENEGYVPESCNYNALINIANSFRLKRTIDLKKSDIDSIVYYAEKALIETKKSNDIRWLVHSYLLIGSAETLKGNYNKAETILLEALDILLKYKSHFELKRALYFDISRLYESTGQFEKSTEFLKETMKFYIYSDYEKYMKEGLRKEAKYQLEKKEQEIEFRKKQNYLYAGIAIIFALALLFLSLFFRYRVKYLKKKREEASLKAQLKEEEAIGLEIGKENAELLAKLKKEEAGKLQKEVIAQHMQISRKNEILENLQNDFKNNPNFNTEVLKKMIKNEDSLDKNFDDFKVILNEIHPEFYTRLQEKAHQKLTALDLKYCVYIFMKMPSKEMADLLHVELRTIRTNKYRLKLKLGLDKEVDLEEFIQKMM